MEPSRFSQQLIRKKMKRRINIDLTNSAVEGSIQVIIKGSNVTITYDSMKEEISDADQAEIEKETVRSSEAEA